MASPSSSRSKSPLRAGSDALNALGSNIVRGARKQLYRRSRESLQGWAEPLASPEEIIAMLREYDAVGGVASKLRTARFVSPRPPILGLPATSPRSPCRPESRSGAALAQLLDASLPEVDCSLPSSEGQGGSPRARAHVPLEPVLTLPRAVALDPSQLAKRKRHLLSLQTKYEKRTLGQPDAPPSDPDAWAVLEEAYPNDSADTIQAMCGYMASLGKYRRAASEQATRERDLSLLRALDDNGDGKIQYKEFMGLARATGLDPKRMRAKFVQRDLTDSGELSMKDMEQILTELRDEAIKKQVEGEERSAEERALQKYAQTTNPDMSKLVEGLI